MINKILAGFILVFVISFSGYAADNADDNKYKDWNDVVSLLRLKGIIASKINWAEIEAACMIVKSTQSDVDYNKCRFDKAVLQNQYESDNNYCNAFSQQKYFEYIKPSITKTIILDSKGEKISATEQSKVVLTTKQINSFKNTAFMTCMHDNGWNDVGSWTNGKR